MSAIGQRTAAKGRFTRALNLFNNEADDKEHDIAELTLAFSDVERAWKNVEEKYDIYIASLTEGDEADENWIIDLQSLYKGARKGYTSLKNASVKNETLTTHRCTLNTAYNNFIIMCDNSKTLIKGNASKELLSKERESINQQYNQVKEAHNAYSIVSGEQEEKKNLDWINRTSEISLEINSLIDKYIQKVNESNNRPNFRLQKIPLPKFEGNVRNFPRFKRDFVLLVQPALSPNEAAFGLRQCLSSEVEKCLGSCDDNVDNMLKVLDKKFGDPCKITDAVVSEIRNFKAINPDQKHFIVQFINCVEKGYVDLKYIDMEKEISNANVVSMIENKLPRYIAERWYLKMHQEDSEIDRKNKFPSLLSFLKTERDALEYGLSELRYSTSRSSVTYNLGSEMVDSKNEKECLIHNRTDHTTSECNVYNNKTLYEKFGILRRNRACYGCLLPGHVITNCQSKTKCSENCNEFHHPSLHNQEVGSINNYIDPNQKDTQCCLLLIQSIKIGDSRGKYANVFWDSGSSISLITEKKACQLGLSGPTINLNVTTVRGMKQSIKSHEYHINFIDKQGRSYKVTLYGIDSITNEISAIGVNEIVYLFNNVVEADIDRPTGEVDILIGMEYAAWHPVKEQSYEHLVVYKNIFGRCLGGYHKGLTENTRKIINLTDVVHLISSPISIQKFFDVESMGTECRVPRCGSCRCGKCPVGGKEFTIKEERELALIERNVQFCGDHWVATYPWLRSPSELPNNYYQILKCLEKIERQLRDNTEYAGRYCSQVDDMINRGVARKLTEHEIKTYNGPVYYIAHHGVQKDSSKSTPLRIVFNSSKPYKGHCLNDYWAKGPDSYINNLLGCLIKFREERVGLVGDIRKMYNSVRTSTIDQHCHRFLWRGMGESVDPSIYVITAVNFGDRPSGTIAAVALRKTAIMERERFPQASKVVLESTYVDDIIDSVENIEVAKELTEDITTMLKKGNFHMKEWFYSYEVCGQGNTGDKVIDVSLVEDEHVEKILGMKWLVQSDRFSFEMSENLINFFKSPSESIVLTKRIIMSFINGLYDPMGLAVPFTVRGKVLMRKLWGNFPDLSWDDPISNELKVEWTSYFIEMMQLSRLLFERCVKPEGSISNPDMILFSDASNDAYGACCFLRWMQADGTGVSRLLLAKSRVAPLKIQSIVRLELCAAVLSKRLRCFVEKYCRLSFNKVFHIVDSQIVRCMIQKESYGFNTFVATRVGEIQESTEPTQWYWISGKDNIADIITRGVAAEEIGLNSLWQNGPTFLSTQIESWPISNSVTMQDLPERNKIIMTVVKNTETCPIDIDRFSKYLMLIRITARILSVRKTIKNSLKNLLESPNARDLEGAELFWIKECQKPMQPEFQKAITGKGSFRKMCPKLNDGGIYVVGGRAEKWVEVSYNKQEIPIISSKHRFARLMAEHTHRSGHLGVESDIAKVRANYWVVGLRKLCRTIRYSCIDCRKRDGQVASQVMGKLPVERLKPAPAWAYVGVDLFGPYSVRGDVNKRSTMKVYGVIFTCLLIRAVYLDVAVDYSTDGFLMVFRRFISLRGCPIKLYSDSGPQLVGTSNELKRIVEGWDWQKIKDFGADKGIEWHFSPGDAPWWNGCVESLIKSVKKGLHHAIGLQRISFSEMLTVMFEVANLVNERPVGAKPDSTSEFTYLCPNDLILGRSSSRIPSGPWNETADIKKRFYFIQTMINSYWKKWTQCYFPSLMIRQKWHHQRRNMKIGDVIIIQDKNVVRGQWRIGRISAVTPDDDGIVRNVAVEYKHDGSASFTTINRPVQRLILLVPIDEDFNGK